MTVATPDPDRLNRIEAMLESIVRIQGNQQEALNKHQKSLDLLVDGQLGLQSQLGIIAEQTRQLKRAVDYLLATDGGNGEPKDIPNQE